MIVVMARVPEPGRTKTRLIPRLGPAGAAQLSAAMTGDVFDIVRSTGLPWKVSIAGDVKHPWVRTIDTVVEPQVEGDIGARLTHALRDGGVAIGTDAPTLPAALLREAHGSTADVVIAPAFDGGYVLVGVEAGVDVTALFADIPWSSPDTYASQVERTRNLELSLRTLPFWYDIDSPADLAFIAGHLPTLPASVAPRTRAFLEALNAAPHR